MTRLLTGYDPDHDVEFLLTVWESGEAEIATRPGNGQRWLAWGPPIELEETE